MATKTWIHNSGAGAWNDPDNWSTDTVPMAGDAAVFDSGTVGTAYTVTGDGSADSLTDAGDSVTFDSGTLTIDTGGVDVLAAGTMTLARSASLTTSGTLAVGDSAASASLVVQGAAAAASVDISGPLSTVTVSGAGAVLSGSSALTVESGANAFPYRLTVSDGGEASTAGTLSIGAVIGPQTLDTQQAAVLVEGAGSILAASTVIVGADTVGILDLLDGGAVVANSLVLDDPGQLMLDDLSSITGGITLAGGQLMATTEPGDAQVGPGTITLANAIVVAAPSNLIQSFDIPIVLTGVVSGFGTLDLDGGTIELDNALNTISGTIEVSPGTLVLGNATAAGSATIALGFDGPSQLTIDGTAMPGNIITQVQASSAIDLANVAGGASGSVTLNAGNVLAVVEDGTTYDLHLDPRQHFSGFDFTLSTDASGTGTLITETAATCYCPGTLIATPAGERPVEALAIGDMVLTAAGAVPIRWIGHRHYDGRFVAGNHLMLPIRIAAGALGAGVPRRDLHVSPGHGLYLDGVLVPAWRLINGSSITQAPQVDAVTYIHIELDAHDIILAEGAPAESFLDDGCRGQFQNAAEFHARYPGGTPTQSPIARVEDGFQLQAIQRRVAWRAGIAPMAPRPPGPLRGFVDQAGPQIVCGWAQDADAPEEPVCLEVTANGRRVCHVLANGYRADLRRAGLGSGCHAFSIRLPDGTAGAITVRRAGDSAALVPTADAAAPAALAG
jgi:hypothetical protein